jgi:hypothetical protein
MAIKFNRRRDVTDRMDADFKEDMKRAARIRVKNKLAEDIPRERSLREMTRLLRNTDGFRISLEELRIKPKKDRK